MFEHDLPLYQIIFLIACATIVVESITEIIVESEIAAPIRNFVARRALPDVPTFGTINYIALFLHKLISCGYCTSVWIAAIIAIWAGSLFGRGFLAWVCMTMVLHRLSNSVHVAYELMRKGRVRTYDVLMKSETANVGSVRQSEAEGEPEAEQADSGASSN